MTFGNLNFTADVLSVLFSFVLFRKVNVMNLRTSTIFKLLRTCLGILGLWALAGSAMAVWDWRANEGGNYIANQGDFVRYGNLDFDNCNICNGSWLYKKYNSGEIVNCSNAGFGGDPFPNRVKRCERLREWRFLAEEGDPRAMADILAADFGWAPNSYRVVMYTDYDGVHYQDSPGNNLIEYIGTTGTTGHKCNNSTFGGDPAVDRHKYCLIAVDVPSN